MSWLYLFIAGIFEVIWVLIMKHCTLKLDIFSLSTLAAMCGSVIFLALAMKNIPNTIAYCIWTGIGVVGVFLYNSLILNERLSILQITFIIMISISIIGLKLSQNH